jgi:pyruvate ferredoxin oxidoreductase alpha subunit
MRPGVMTVANRAVGAPSTYGMTTRTQLLRDTGWIQLYAEDVQEASVTIINSSRSQKIKTLCCLVWSA